MTRGPTSAPFGKLTEELRIGIDEQTNEILTALAFAADMPKAEYIRVRIYKVVYGEAAMLRARMKP